jgi:thiol-disulfide isomerase/thioredoxin/Flp pilus assembly protein TadD
MSAVLRRCFIAGVSLAVSSSGMKGQTAAPAPAATPGADDFHAIPKFVDAMKEAKQFERQKQALFAANAYKKANKIAGGQCPECLEGLYREQMMLADSKGAVATTMLLETLASSPAKKSIAVFDRGMALMPRDGQKLKPAQLEEAHAAFQQSLTLSPRNINAMYYDGKVLAELGKMEEARSEFQQCLSCLAPTDPARLRAKHFADDPELATHQMAPPFEVTAMDGTKFNLDAMGGRVVLIDFWATWCGPCNRELPHMRKIAKEFANDPLVIISVSWDSDEAKWKDFIAKNEMTWVQYRDADHALANEFGIDSIPHYFTIDSDGVLTAEMLGADSDVEGKLKKLIAKAKPAKVQAGVPLRDSGVGGN